MPKSKKPKEEVFTMKALKDGDRYIGEDGREYVFNSRRRNRPTAQEQFPTSFTPSKKELTYKERVPRPGRVVTGYIHPARKGLEEAREPEKASTPYIENSKEQRDSLEAQFGEKSSTPFLPPPPVD